MDFGFKTNISEYLWTKTLEDMKAILSPQYSLQVLDLAWEEFQSKQNFKHKPCIYAV